MAYTNHSDRKVLADASLNNLYTDGKYRGFSREPESLVSWNTDRGRSYSDVKISPAAGQRTPTSVTSPASLRSKNEISRRLCKDLTCYYWTRPKGCRYASEECLYAHEIKAKMAQAPVQVEEGSEFSFPHLTYSRGAGPRADYAVIRTRSGRQKRVEPSPCLHQLATGAFTINDSKLRVRISATGQ